MVRHLYTVFSIFVGMLAVSTALPHTDQTTGDEKGFNGSAGRRNSSRQLRTRIPDKRRERNVVPDIVGVKNGSLEEDLQQLKREHSVSFPSRLSGTESADSLQKTTPNQNVLQICRRVHLNFARAANGRDMHGGDFVRGEWFHRYGINIYADGHDGTSNLHPMIFDSSNLESNGLVGNKEIFSLGSPNFDCGGFGIGHGGKEGAPGENCEPLGNVLIPSRKAGSDSLTSSERLKVSKPSLGGVLHFKFSKLTKVENIGLLNISGANQIIAVRNDGGMENIDLVPVGQNGSQNVSLDLDQVNELFVILHSFGAVSGLDLCIVFDQ